MDYLFSVRAFVAVGELGSFTKASEMLHVSKSSLSRAVSDLEARVSARLLNRSTRHVALAEGARDYYRTCSTLLSELHTAELHTAEQRLLREHDQLAGVVRVVVHPLALMLGIEQVLSSYKARFPQVSTELMTHSAPLNLAHSGCDVAFYPRHLVNNQEVIYRPLISSVRILVAAPSYLAKNLYVHNSADLSGQTIIYSDDYEMHSAPLLKRNGVPMRESQPLHRLVVGPEAARRLAVSGAGLAVLPQCLIGQELAAGQLRCVLTSCTLTSERLELGAQYMSRELMPCRVRAFLDETIHFFGAMPGIPVVPKPQLAA